MEKIEVEKYRDELRDQWDDFVWQANNGTIFHTRKFLSYHPADRFEDHSLVLKKNEKLIALFPATVRYEAQRRILTSHRGASYGGLVTKYNLSIRDAFRIVEAVCEFAVENNFDGIELTPPPIIYYLRPSHYIDFALIRNGFGYRKREISSIIPLTFSASAVLTTFSSESRRAVRRAVKLGVRIRETEDYESFYQILKQNLKMRHNVQPTHSVEELKRIKTLFPERIKLFGAYLEQEMIAGVVIFECNPRVVLAFYISHNEQRQQYRGVNCLFFEIVRWAIQNQFGHLDFGIFTVNMEPNWGLGRFKESFGAQGIFRDTFLKYFD
ncbi:MAG: GNAT family N-acetyltransferase [bacterium]|nr:GNAT family N-acetyltransferase [bacterium]